MHDKNLHYFFSIQSHDSQLNTLRSYAEEHQVPIVDQLSLDLILQIIRLKKPKNILEIGCAIGYSSMHFASIDSSIHVTTIERNKEMIQLARQNFATFGYEKQIRLIEQDALQAYHAVSDRQYDMIFIDAAKAQSQKFFELYQDLIPVGGLIITDNVLYHGFVADIDIVKSRNVKQMVKKVKKFNEWLVQQNHFTTNFVNMDDGLAISIKEYSND